MNNDVQKPRDEVKKTTSTAKPRKRSKKRRPSEETVYWYQKGQYA